MTDQHPRVHDLFECPVCGKTDLECVSDGEATNFLCVSCGRCWHVELGYVHRVDPMTCPGCSHLAVCRARAASLRRESDVRGG